MIAKDQEQADLLDLSRELLLTDLAADTENELCKLVLHRLGLTGLAVWIENKEHFCSCGLGEGTREALQAAVRARQNYDLPSQKRVIRLLRSGERVMGAFAIEGTESRTPPFWDGIASLMSNSLERVKASKMALLADSVRASEQFRSALIDGLAHSVKTPLTTIAVSASGLIVHGGLSEDQTSLARTIEKQALHIANLTDKVIYTARLEGAELQPRKSRTDLKHICESAAQTITDPKERARLILPRGRDGTHFVWAVGDLLALAAAQIFENALKYSPANSEVQVTLQSDGTVHRLAVCNVGSYVPVDERILIFERHYRGRETRHLAAGTGLGLAIARGIVLLHEGNIRVTSEVGQGTAFQIEIPGTL